MRDINKVMLMGRLGADPVLRTTQNGTAVTNISLATDSYVKEGPTETTWHRIVVWGKPAEWCCERLTKGSPLFIEGRIKTKKYEDSEGIAKYMTEIHTDQVHFLPRHKRNEAGVDPVEAAVQDFAAAVN